MRYFYLLLTFIICFNLHAAQWATVKVDKAIIYAHSDLTSAIGFVPMDKKILVGSKARRKGTVLPIIVSGKIAWIQIKDLVLSERYEDQKVVESRFYDRKFQGREQEKIRPVKALSNISMSGGVWDPGSGQKEASLFISGEESKSYGTQFHIKYRHNPYIDQRVTWGAGFSYFAVSDNNFSLQVPALMGEGIVNIRQEENYLLDFIIGVSYAPSANSTLFENKENGSAFGWHLDLRLSLFTQEDWGLITGIGYQSLKTNIENQAEVGNQLVTLNLDDTTFSGPHIYAGVLYRLNERRDKAPRYQQTKHQGIAPSGSRSAIEASLGLFSPGGDLDLPTDVSGDEGGLGKQIHLRYRHNPKAHQKLNWALGSRIATYSNAYYEVFSFMFEAEALYNIFAEESLLLEGFFGLIVSPINSISIPSINYNESEAGFGYKLGTQLTYYKDSKWGFIGALGLQNLSLGSASPGSTLPAPSFSGLYGNLGIAYRL